MNDVEKIEQLASALASGNLTSYAAERKKCELTNLLFIKFKFRLEDEDNAESVYDPICFAEAFAVALDKYNEKPAQVPFVVFFKSCYNQKAFGIKADKLKRDNHEVFSERLAAMKEFIEKIGKAEGLDYQVYKDRLRYLNKEKILAQLQTWGIRDKYLREVEDILTQNKISYIEEKRNTASEAEDVNPYDLLPDIPREDTSLQSYIAEIIEISYALSRKRKLFPLNNCEWSGNLYENYARVIPTLFDAYLEKKYLSFYEAQAIWQILANELLGAYLHYAPETVRKKRKQLEAINLQAWREVGGANV